MAIKHWNSSKSRYDVPSEYLLHRDRDFLFIYFTCFGNVNICFPCEPCMTLEKGSFRVDLRRFHSTPQQRPRDQAAQRPGASPLTTSKRNG